MRILVYSFVYRIVSFSHVDQLLPKVSTLQRSWNRGPVHQHWECCSDIWHAYDARLCKFV